MKLFNIPVMQTFNFFLIVISWTYIQQYWMNVKDSGIECMVGSPRQSISIISKTKGVEWIA
jgi:hypothetical protein